MDAPQVDVGGDGCHSPALSKSGRRWFQNYNFAQGVKRRVFDRGQPAVSRVGLLELRDFVHDVLHVPGSSGRVARLPVNARKVAAEGGRFFMFVLGGDEAVGFVLVAGLEGFLFLGDEVFAVVDTKGGGRQCSIVSCSLHVVNMNQPIDLVSE